MNFLPRWTPVSLTVTRDRLIIIAPIITSPSRMTPARMANGMAQVHGRCRLTSTIAVSTIKAWQIRPNTGRPVEIP